MLSRERFDAALDLQASDRFPLFYQHLGGAKWVLARVGRTMREGFHDPEAAAAIALGARDLYDFDNVMAGWGDILVEAQAHGMQWKFPERDLYPRADKHVPLAETDRIQPVDPLKDRFWSVPLRAGGIMQKEIGWEVAVVAGVVSPFLIVSGIIGYENMMMGLLSAPAPIDDLLGTVLESVRMYGEALPGLGIEDVFVEDGSAGMEQNSPELCERYDQKYLGEQLSHYRMLGLRTIIHNCSASPYLELNARHRANAIHFSMASVDAALVFQRLKGRTCVMAGMDQDEVLFKGTPDEVEAKARDTCALWGHEAGFMLAPDEMPSKTPVENIVRLRECVDRYGR
jgi:uroporphyrinogen-III decarboxylase